MSFKFNPFTGTFDIDNNDGGAGPGPSTNFLELTIPAGETISALKLVYEDSGQLFYASNLLDHRPIGVSLSAGNIGENITVITFGEIDDPSFLFASNETLFLNGIGTISSSPPSAGNLIEIGYGLGSGRIFLNIKQQIVL